MSMPELRQCRHCELWLLEAPQHFRSFTSRGRTYLKRTCRECEREYTRQWCADYPERGAAPAAYGDADSGTRTAPSDRDREREELCGVRADAVAGREGEGVGATGAGRGGARQGRCAVAVGRERHAAGECPALAQRRYR